MNHFARFTAPIATGVAVAAFLTACGSEERSASSPLPPGAATGTTTTTTPPSATGAPAAPGACVPVRQATPGGPAARRVQASRAFRLTSGGGSLKLRVARVRFVGSIARSGGGTIPANGGFVAVEYRARNAGRSAVTPASTVNRAFVLRTSSKGVVLDTDRSPGCRQVAAAYAAERRLSPPGRSLPAGKATVSVAVYPTATAPKAPTWLAKPPGINVVLGTPQGAR